MKQRSRAVKSRGSKKVPAFVEEIKKLTMAENKKKRRKKRRGSKKAPVFAEAINDLLETIEREYEGDTSRASFYSAVTVVAGAFVWAIHRGCPPSHLTAVMSEALAFALKTEGLVVECMIPERPLDPMEVN